MDFLGSSVSDWLVPVLAVGLLGALTLVFALFVGRWIDAQSHNVVDEPKKTKNKQ